MNRDAFMKELEKLLYDISPEERENALEYYHDYFEDAGAENEAAVIRELGSPERVARTIKEGLYAAGANAGEYTEQGYRDRYDHASVQMPAGPDTCSHQRQTTREQKHGAAGSGTEPKNKKEWDLSKILLVVILCILALPVGSVLVGIGAAVLGVILAVLATIFGLLVALFGVTIAGIVGGVGLIISSFFMIFTPGSALLTAGAGCFMLMTGILLLILCVWVCGGLIPAIFRGFVKLCKKAFRRGGATV